MVGDHACDEVTERSLLSEIADGIARCGPLAKVVVHGTNAVQRIAQEADVKKKDVPRMRQRVANLMAGESLETRVGIDGFQYFFRRDGASALWCIEAVKAFAEAA